MLIDAADQHAVFLDQPEARRRLARAGQDARVARAAHQLEHLPALRRDARAARQHVQAHPLAEQQVPDGAGHGRDGDLAAGGGGVEGVALLEVPLDGAAALGEDLVEEGDASEEAGGLAVQRGGAGRGADDEAAVVEGGGIFGEPGRDLGFVGEGEEVGGVAVGEGHCGCELRDGMEIEMEIEMEMMVMEDERGNGGGGQVMSLKFVRSGVPEGS